MTINRLDFYSNCFKIAMCINVQTDSFNKLFIGHHISIVFTEKSKCMKKRVCYNSFL